MTASEPPADDSAAERPRRQWLRWLIGLVSGFVLLVVIGGVVFVVATRNPEVSAFYTPPDDLSGAPGTILRSEPFTDGMPTDARAWKVLYVSTDEHDQPIAVSGLVIVPFHPPDGPRPVLAWAHGTTGIARACAPSATDAPLEGIPDMTGPLDQGWVITLTDYPGLGTPSPHPYLVGQSEGRAVLDSVRAAHLLDTGVELADRYAIWGHSQGGHAALFAGQLSAAYLPEQQLVGVVALAPATRLAANLAAVRDTDAGKVLSVFAYESWTDYYPDIPDDTLTDQALGPARRLADVCLNQPSRYRIVIVGLTFPSTIFRIDPITDPTWLRLLDANSPDPGAIVAPVLVGQGLADELIVPDVTKTWVEERCAVGRTTEWHTYPDVNHTGVVGPGGADALSWTIDRFEGSPAVSECPAA